MIKKYAPIIGVFLLFITASAIGQSQSVQQSGTVTASHAPVWVYNGVQGDAGTSDNPQTSTFGVYGTGTPLCVNNTKSHTGQYYKLCLGYASDSSSASLSLIPYGGASTIPLNININGTVYPIGGSNWLSSIIDSQLGSTQGDILYRNATVWTVLPPAVSGFLATNGASANPSWAPGTSLSAIAANSVLANTTSGSAVPGGAAVPSCSATTSILQYTTNTGFNCEATSAMTGVSLTAGVTGVLPVANGGSGSSSQPKFTGTRITSTQTVTSGTTTKVQLNSIRIDNASYWNAGTFLYQPLVAGTYQACGSVYASAGTAISSLQVDISKNGTSGSGGTEIAEVINNYPAGLSFEGLAVPCTNVAMNGSTDTLELDVTATGTGAMAVNQVRSATQMSINWVGP